MAPTPATSSLPPGAWRISKCEDDREGQFHSQVFERYNRYEPEVAEALTQMFVSGVSTHKVGEIAATLTGVAPSASAVSRLNQTLTEQYEAWRERRLLAHLASTSPAYSRTLLHEAQQRKTVRQVLGPVRDVIKHLRMKLTPFSLAIVSLHGLGYQLTTASSRTTVEEEETNCHTNRTYTP